MTIRVFDDRPCTLGEGPLWHPGRGQLFWFDILGQRLLTRDAHATAQWDFDGPVSAAGWVDDGSLLVASDRALTRFDIATGARETVIALEDDNPLTRSNDGRADPFGGFWIGTMGKSAEPRAGAIWRYYRGELRRLFPDITIPNAICFAPDGTTAYFADTARRAVWRQRMDSTHGWPEGEPEVFLDLDPEGLNPDGAVVDSAGTLWLALWGAGRVAAYTADGSPAGAVEVPARQPSCPAFGGDGLATLHITTARQDLPADVLATEPGNGQTFAAEPGATGQAEHAVIL